MTTADGQYLEQFVFDPGGKVSRSKYKFPRESPAKKDWEVWFNFWHDYTATGDKLHTPLRTWMATNHRRWIWYYESSNNDLYRLENGKVNHYRVEDIPPTFKRGAPTSVVNFTNTNVNKPNAGVPLATGPRVPTDFWKEVDVGKYRREPAN